MNPQSYQTIDDYIAILKRRRWQIMLPALVIFGAVASVAATLPPVYRSTGTILIEEQEIPSDLVQSTVTSYAGERIEIISQKVMTAENLGRIMERYDLYPEVRRDVGLAYAVRQMSNDITHETISANVANSRGGRPQEVAIAFSLSFDHESPDVAQQVAADIIELFLEENARDRKETAEKTSEFLRQEAQKLADEIDMLESQLAEFKETHADRLPELWDFNLERMKRTEERLRDQEQQIRTLEEQRVYLRAELAATTPYTALYSTTGERVLTPADRLRVLEAEQVSLAARYSRDHPSRARVERELAALRDKVGQHDPSGAARRLVQQQAELQALEERYSDEHPDVKTLRRAVAATKKELAQGETGSASVPGVDDANNPAYVQLQTRLAVTEADLASARTAREELLASLREYEQRITGSPQIEREYKTLTRDYNSALDSYKAILEKLSSARLAEALESESKGERFSLIEPPPLPKKPFKPNRLGVVFLGFVLSVGGGMGHAVLREGMDKRIYGSRAVERVIGSPPVATIPFITTSADRRRRAVRFWVVGIGLVAGIAVIALLIHLFVIPLDDMWMGLFADSAEGE